MNTHGPLDYLSGVSESDIGPAVMTNLVSKVNVCNNLNNNELDAPISNPTGSTLPLRQTLVAGGRPGLRVSVSNIASPPPNAYSTYETHSQISAQSTSATHDVPLGPPQVSPGPNGSSDYVVSKSIINNAPGNSEMTNMPGSLSPLSAASPLLQAQSPSQYPPPSPAPSEGYSTFPHSPEGYSSGGLSPAAANEAVIDTSQVAPPTTMSNEDAPQTPLSGRLRGRNPAPRGNRGPPLQTSGVDSPAQTQPRSADPYPGRSHIPSIHNTRRSDKVDTRFNRSRGRSVGASPSNLAIDLRGPCRRGQEGSTSAGASRDPSPFLPRSGFAEVANASFATRMVNSQGATMGQLGLSMPMDTAGIISAPLAPPVEIGRAPSPLRNLDGGQSDGFSFPSQNCTNDFVFDPSHSQHFLPVPSASLSSPVHSSHGQSPISPNHPISPGYGFPPNTPLELLPSPSSHSPTHAVQTDSTDQWSSHQSSPFEGQAAAEEFYGSNMNRGMGSTAPPPAHGIPGQIDATFIDGTIASVSDYTGLNLASSSTNGFPDSHTDNQLSPSSQPNVANLPSNMANFMPSHTTMNVASPQQEGIGYSAQPFTKAQVEAIYGSDMGHHVALSEQANSSGGYSGSDPGNEAPNQFDVVSQIEEILARHPQAGTQASDPLKSTFSPQPQSSTSQLYQQSSFSTDMIPPLSGPDIHVPWDQLGRLHQFREPQQVQRPYHAQQIPQPPPPSQLLHPESAQKPAASSSIRRFPARKRSHSASEIFYVHPEQPQIQPIPYTQPTIHQGDSLLAPPSTDMDLRLGGEGGANLRPSKSLNSSLHRKTHSAVPSITVTPDGSGTNQLPTFVQQYQTQPHDHHDAVPYKGPTRPPGPQHIQSAPLLSVDFTAPPQAGPSRQQNNLRMNSRVPPNLQNASDLQMQPSPLDLHPLPNHCPPPNQLYMTPSTSTESFAETSLKPKLQGQRAEVDEVLLRKAFTEEGKYNDPALRMLLDFVRGAPWYRNEEREPMQGTLECERIFSQIRIQFPDDKRFALQSPTGAQAGTSTSTMPLRDAQSIYLLFTDDNMCLICGKKTDRSTRALGHIRSDIGHRPFHCSCEKCSTSTNPRRFFSESLLDDHLKGQTHKQKCPICGQEYRRGGISRHMDSKHPDNSRNPNAPKRQPPQ